MASFGLFFEILVGERRSSARPLAGLRPRLSFHPSQILTIEEIYAIYLKGEQEENNIFKSLFGADDDRPSKLFLVG